jgi:hypothetical protein
VLRGRSPCCWASLGLSAVLGGLLARPIRQETTEKELGGR